MAATGAVLGVRDVVGGLASQDENMKMMTDYPKTVSVSNRPEDQFEPWVELNMKHLAWNLKETRRRVENRPIMAVVKCNAYGHGMLPITRELQNNGVHHFAVAKVWAGVQLRENNIKGMILNLGAFSKKEAEYLVKHEISQSVFSPTIEWLAAEAKRQNKQAKVHIKIDTGLGRVGIPADDALAYIEKVAAMPDIKIEGVLTVCIQEHVVDPLQIEKFLKICAAAKRKGITLGLRHAAASGQVADFPYTYLDMVRPGNCLLGLEPLPNMNLKPVYSLKSRVLLTKRFAAGSVIGWGSDYPINKDTTFAYAPIGYYDGFPPDVSGKAVVLIRGHRYPISAFISADHTFIDITGADDIQIGDEIVFVGKQGNQEITNVELGEISGRGVYGLPERLNPHLPRLPI